MEAVKEEEEEEHKYSLQKYLAHLQTEAATIQIVYMHVYQYGT